MSASERSSLNINHSANRSDRSVLRQVFQIDCISVAAALEQLTRWVPQEFLAGTASGISSFNLTMTNTSTQTIFTPIRVEVAQLTSASGRVKANNADNGLNGVGAYWDYDTRVGTDNILSAGETSGPRLLKFTNSSSEPFTVTFNVIGTLQRSGAPP